MRRAAMLATLLLAACPSPARTPAGEQQTSPGKASTDAPSCRTAPLAPTVDIPGPSPQPSDAKKPDSRPSGPHPDRVVFPAKPACPGGLDIPEFDPAKAPWWDKLTKDQRIAFIESGAYKHWSAVTDSPIVLHDTKAGLVLRSVDGCWRQELTTERHANVLLIDGLSGLAWQWRGEGLRLVDLWNPGAPVSVLAGRVKAEDLAIVGEDWSTLVQWSEFKEGTRREQAPRARLQWSAAPKFMPAKANDATSSLTPEGERWLVEHLDRQARGPRTTRINVFPARRLPAESRCKDPAVCLNAGPFGAGSLEYVYYGENQNIVEEYEGGPVCALFDPSSGEWYKDPTRTTKVPDPGQLDINETLCKKWEFDVTGRAFLDGDQVCVSTQCVRAEGESLGFVRGSVFISM